MGEERGQCALPGLAGELSAEARTAIGGRRLDCVALAVLGAVITLSWLPTLTSGARISPNEDFLLHASRHEAVRKSLLEYHTLPLRSPWLGGGFPTLGEPEDPALSPQVLLSVAFGSAMGIKLLAYLLALAAGLGTYGLTRWVLDYTRWGALFSSLVVGAGLYVPAQMEAGNIPECYVALLPLYVLLVALACRGRRGALFALPLVLYAALSCGKQGFFVALLCAGLLCLLDALPPTRFLNAETARGAARFRAMGVLALVVGVAFLVGMVRILPALEFLGAKGGLTGTELVLHEGTEGDVGPNFTQLLRVVSGIGADPDIATVGWLPLVLFGIACCCSARRTAPWIAALVLFGWIALGSRAPLNLYGMLDDLPVFSTITRPYKYFTFPIVMSIAVGAGQFFWLLRRLRAPWMGHACAAGLVVAAVAWLCPGTIAIQRGTYTTQIPAEYRAQQPDFFNVRGLGLPRNRSEPSRAVTYLNLLQNVGTIDWHTALPLPENAVPRYFVDVDNNSILNPMYRGETWFLEASRTAPSTSPEAPSQTLPSSAEPSGGFAAQGAFAPNSIAVEVTVPRPGTLVINQNYHSAWRTDRGELFDYHGLLAVRLRRTGAYTVRLQYLPRSFVVGLAVTILGLSGWTLACTTFAGRWLGRWRGAGAWAEGC